MSQRINSKELYFILDRFEGAKAVLLYEGQELVVPRRFLDKDAQEGDAIYSELICDKKMEKRRENLARAVLQEILRGE
ncbi:MAG: DUF3006 family protein [bacterium]|nr:DUF3006 family protein [bacterium]